MRCFSIAIAFLSLAFLAVAMSYSQSWANPGHKQSFSMVMDGLSGENFWLFVHDCGYSFAA